MFRRLFISSTLLLFSLFQSIPSKAQAVDIKVAILTSDMRQIGVLTNLVDDFEAMFPAINVHIKYYSDEVYKQNLPQWLDHKTFDVLHWHGGKRLYDLVAKEQVLPVFSVFAKEKLESIVPTSVLAQVSQNGQVWALPFAQYTWGFYYNKTYFQQLNLSPPNTWSEFLTICNTLKNNGIPPLVQANQGGWPVLAWLDYLSMTAGGIQLRNKLLQQQPLSKSDKRKLMGYFSSLLTNDYFFAPNHNWRWQQSIRIVLLNRAAMTLMGQFANSIISPQQSDSIGFFPFPMGATNYIEVSPLEVFFIAKSTKKTEQVKRFLAFMTQPSKYAYLAQDLGYMPINLPQIYDQLDLGERDRIAAERLIKAAGRIHFFDREASDDLAAEYADLFIKSIASQDVSALSKAL